MFSSNRTFMELKWNTRRKGGKKLNSSNRTFMELKWNTRRKGGKKLNSSNRTFMELKSGRNITQQSIETF